MTPPIQQMLYAQVPKEAAAPYIDVGNRSGNRGVWAGGYHSGSARDIIDYANIGASTADATDFGDINNPRSRTGAVSNSSRGVWGGGSPNQTDMDYVTISSTGDATDFGDLSTTLLTPVDAVTVLVAYLVVDMREEIQQQYTT